MKIRYGNVEILCDECIETDGIWTIYQGGVPIKQLANITDPEMVEAEDGEIEHSPSPLERAKAELEAKKEELRELLADEEAMKARLERIRTLLASLGESLTLTKLIQFVKDLKTILAELDK